MDISYIVINSIKADFIAPILETFQKYFDSSNSTPSNTFITYIENIKRNYNNKLEQFEMTINETAEESTLPRHCVAFGHQIQPKFNKIFNILKKYNGKNHNQANAFANELLQEFDAEVMFKDITAQLSTLFAQAKSENNKPLMQAINELIAFLKTKKAEMGKKKSYELLSGIVTRMKS